MRSDLFDASNSEKQSTDSMTLQNSYMLRSRVIPGRDVISLKGAMIAYQGSVEFAHEGSSSVGQMFKKMVSSDNQPLMRVKGDGDVFFGSQGGHLHLLTLEGGDDAVTVNGSNLLAFDASLSYDITRVQGAGALSGGMFNTLLRGAGTACIVSHGQPVILDCSQQPTYTDINATVAWSANLKPQIKKSFSAGSLVGRGSGEAFQYAFSGPGWVIVQPFETIATQ